MKTNGSFVALAAILVTIACGGNPTIVQEHRMVCWEATPSGKCKGHPAVVEDDVGTPELEVMPTGPTLDVFHDGTTPPSGIVLGGTSRDVTTVCLQAGDKEGTAVRSITATNCLLDAPGPATDCHDGTWGTDAAVRSVTLFSEAYAWIGRGILSHGVVTFLDSAIIVVPASKSKCFTLAVDANQVGVSGAPSGSQFQLNVAGVVAVGVNSGENATVIYNGSSVDKLTLGKPMVLQ